MCVSVCVPGSLCLHCTDLTDRVKRVHAGSGLVTAVDVSVRVFEL